jgi:hypothetical protein
VSVHCPHADIVIRGTTPADECPVCCARGHEARPDVCPECEAATVADIVAWLRSDLQVALHPEWTEDGKARICIADALERQEWRK